MRVFHVNCNYIGTTLHQLMIEKLDKAGFDNLVYVPTYNKNNAVIVPNSNVIVSECFKKWDRLLFDYKQGKILRDIEAKADVSAYDCIHAYTLFTDGNCARALSKKYGIPYVVAIRNTDVNDFFRLMPHLRSRGVAIMRDAAAVFFLSDAYRKQVFEKYVPQKYHDEIAAKTHIIPNGIDDFWLEHAPEKVTKDLSDKKVKLVYAGRIEKNKNIPTTQKAMAILREKGYDVTLTVIGRAADPKEAALVESDPYTTCIPHRPKEELIESYKASDIFVMPSFMESFGLVYAEAMSQGLPVLYSRGQGFDKQFPDGTVGFPVDPNAPSSVAQAIEQVLKRYSEIANHALQNVNRFNWDTICQKYACIYESIELKGNGPSDGHV